MPKREDSPLVCKVGLLQHEKVFSRRLSGAWGCPRWPFPVAGARGPCPGAPLGSQREPPPGIGDGGDGKKQLRTEKHKWPSDSSGVGQKQGYAAEHTSQMLRRNTQVINLRPGAIVSIRCLPEERPLPADSSTESVSDG